MAALARMVTLVWALSCARKPDLVGRLSKAPCLACTMFASFMLMPRVQAHSHKQSKHLYGSVPQSWDVWQTLLRVPGFRLGSYG